MHPNATIAEALLTEAQTAEILNVSMRTLQAWRLKDQGPPFVRFGRSIRYRRDQLLDWISAHTVQCQKRQVER